jgi:hypothetical protein
MHIPEGVVVEAVSPAWLEWLHAVVWNQLIYLVRVTPKLQQYDALGLTIGVTLTVLAGWWLVRRWMRA